MFGCPHDRLHYPGGVPAQRGGEEVHHVASPIPVAQPEDPDELIVPTREGMLRVLRTARDAGARRIVLTSSFAAVGYTPKPGAEFTEADWTDPGTPGLAPYPCSKAIAERAAWDSPLTVFRGGAAQARRGPARRRRCRRRRNLRGTAAGRQAFPHR